MANRPLFQSQILCRTYEYPEVTLKISGNMVHMTWSDEINRQVNNAEETLVLQVLKQGRDIPALEKQVTFLNATEFYFDESGPAVISLVRKKRFHLHLTTGFSYTPKVSFVSENEGRHHLTWNDIDWMDMRRRLEISDGIDWEQDVEICLHVVRWPQEGSDLPDEEWIGTGMSDNAPVLGALKHLSLDVMRRGTWLAETDMDKRAAGALVAFTLCPLVKGYLFSGHRSEEPGHRAMLSHLALDPILDLGMRLGEGTGGALAMNVLEAAVRIFREVLTFEQAGVPGKE